MSRTLVIGETGSIHEGHPARMMEMIRVAADCGADVVKMQWVSRQIRRLDWTTHLLHCVSSYPSPLSALNLRTLWQIFRPCEGFSDHSRDVRVGAWAVCAGAEIIEAHFRLDDTDPSNKDYAVSFTPAEFKVYVQNIRDAEAALGDGVKRVQDCEREMLRYRVQS